MFSEAVNVQDHGALSAFMTALGRPDIAGMDARMHDLMWNQRLHIKLEKLDKNDLPGALALYRQERDFCHFHITKSMNPDFMPWKIRTFTPWRDAFPEDAAELDELWNSLLAEGVEDQEDAPPPASGRISPSYSYEQYYEEREVHHPDGTSTTQEVLVGRPEPVEHDPDAGTRILRLFAEQVPFPRYMDAIKAVKDARHIPDSVFAYGSEVHEMARLVHTSKYSRSATRQLAHSVVENDDDPRVLVDVYYALIQVWASAASRWVNGGGDLDVIDTVHELKRWTSTHWDGIHGWRH